jgi:putative ABC transport system ATP-binding protein
MATGLTDPDGADTNPATEQLIIQVTRLVKTYRAEADQIRACDHIDLSVDRGDLIAVTGPSGSGKSTLLHLIGALETPDAGQIVVNGRAITALRGRRLAAYRRTVGFVFQRFHLLPTLTAADNVLAPILPFRVQFDKHDRAHQLLDAVGLAGRENALPARLSGGQQQRVAIARALVNDPPLVLADEPTGNLDSRTGEEVVDLLVGLRDRFGTTVIIASHDHAVARRCDRIIRLRDGRIIEER